MTTVRLPSHFLQRFGASFEQTDDGKGRISATLVPKLMLPRKDDSGAIISQASGYALNKRVVIEQLSKKKLYVSVLNSRMREAYEKIGSGRKSVSSSKTKREWACQAGMADAILADLRAAVLEEMDVYFSRRDVASGGDAKSAVLSDATAELTSSGKPTQSLQYDLQRLFTDEEISKPPLHVVDRQHFALPTNRKTVKLHLALQRLISYSDERTALREDS